ncbi:SDR family NAD(P)-dependent oxidoreductase [Oleisolibacter albus]|uniref:SDR family NAD(P)-dependent oxidoreductase n=1 Tax=Oleisolibacter albus TaxID=2171757 RepID=UPI000DF23D06|nr:SDR family NAD(P)-dependent oxidoreductase [Oleisolibacter albus]
MTHPRTPTPTDGIAWVTGASSGIGEHVALILAARGWTVAASARRGEVLADLARRAGGPGRILPLPLDITDPAAVRTAVAGLEAEHGPVALAVLNAGTYVPDSARTFSAEAFRQTVEVNLMGSAQCLEALLPGMIRRRLGQLVLVSSVAGYRGLPRSLAYGASKAALINLAESLKLDVERFGLKVQLVTPGFIKTPLTDRNDFPMPFLMPVEQAALRLVDALGQDRFEISFPRRFTFWLRRLRCLPYPLYFTLVRRTQPK